VFARVITFYSDSTKMSGVVESLRVDLPHTYASIPGFRGALVLEKPGGNHVIALTVWDDEEGVRASERHADEFAERIGDAIGTSVSRNVYRVIGTTGIATMSEE